MEVVEEETGMWNHLQSKNVTMKINNVHMHAHRVDLLESLHAQCTMYCIPHLYLHVMHIVISLTSRNRSR
jgi:sulfopyruvate decarboxylase TPP-binding subunit